MSLKEKVINASPAFLVRWIAAPYIGGNSPEAALEIADGLWKERTIYSSMDILGEDATTNEEVDFYVNVYLDLLQKMSNAEYAAISIKPSQFGSHAGYEFLYTNVEKIVKEAASKASISQLLFQNYHQYADFLLFQELSF